MSQQETPDRARAARPPHGWVQALVAVVAGLVALIATAAIGLWAAGAATLPAGAFPRVVAATVVLAVGGTVELSGDAGPIAGGTSALAVRPLSVTLAGALALAAGFLRPLRHRAVVGTRELAGWAARLALLWAVALLALAAFARHTFAVSPGGTIGELGDLLDAAPTVGFRADVPRTLVVGLLWLAALLLLSLAVSRTAPLPARLVRGQQSVRPAASAMVALLLAWVAVGAVAGLVVAATQGHPAETFAVILLGLPNLVWLAFTLAIGASWDGRVDGPFGLPMPRVLDQVLRTPDGGTVDLGTLAGHDARVWLLPVLGAALLLGAAVLLAVRSPAGTPPWRHAVRMAVALVLTVLIVCAVVTIHAHYGLSLFGIGDLGGGLTAEVTLEPRIWRALGLAALWGLAAGFLGGPLAAGVHRRGQVDHPDPSSPEPGRG
ncbi:streptophobe family protein [Streptomyces sp. NPDC020965]|uniref:streptophobe family protein n=1 Tax=Streptomyces sp. NPDC020965 TaxID=3365105 RepID=UPI0037905EEE